MPNDVIVSPNTRRPNPIPPGQSQTVKWPALVPPSCTLSHNDFVNQKPTLSPFQLAALARIKVPPLYARKSAERAGFRERNGYHRHGDSCQEQLCAS